MTIYTHYHYKGSLPPLSKYDKTSIILFNCSNFVRFSIFLKRCPITGCLGGLESFPFFEKTSSPSKTICVPIAPWTQRNGHNNLENDITLSLCLHSLLTNKKLMLIRHIL